jgi:MEDS: MEthanogen/methylotroph, DcmR Sensory domain
MATPHSSPAFAHYHGVRFYESPNALARIVSDFLKEGFAAGSAGLIAAAPNVRAAIVRELTLQGVDVAAMEASKMLLMLDARETMARFMVDGKPNQHKFRDAMCAAIRQVKRANEASTVRIFGQMVDVLWQDGEKDAAISLERLWNQLAHTEAFSLLCGYTMGNFYKDAHFEDICREHSHLLSSEGQPKAIVSSEGGRVA